MRTGGYSFFGGTARFGGGLDAERRYYDLLQRWLGRGAFKKDDADVRSRWLMGLARMMATMESEAWKSRAESVPATAIDAQPEWQKIHRMKYLSGVYGDTWLGQRFMAMIMRMTCATPNFRRLANEVEKIMDAAKPPNGGTGVEGFENTSATAISSDGVRYFCILVPWSATYGFGKWLIRPENRALYRAIKWALVLVSPAHTVPALATSDIAASPNRPAWYSDGYKGTAADKDCVGS